MTEKEAYNQYAEKALKVFSLKAKDMGIHSGYYFCALDAYFNMLKLTLQTSPQSELTDAVLSFFTPNTSVVYGKDKGRVVPCLKNVCYEPIDSPESLRDFLEKQKYLNNAN
jgi:uncharacterized protein YyaL (SSP411 family)